MVPLQKKGYNSRVTGMVPVQQKKAQLTGDRYGSRATEKRVQLTGDRYGSRATEKKVQLTGDSCGSRAQK